MLFHVCKQSVGYLQVLRGGRGGFFARLQKKSFCLRIFRRAPAFPKLTHMEPGFHGPCPAGALPAWVGHRPCFGTLAPALYVISDARVVTGWREALLRAYYAFRLRRNVRAVHAYSIIAIANHLSKMPRVPFSSPGTDLRSRSFRRRRKA